MTKTEPTAWLVHADFPYVTMSPPPADGGLPRTALVPADLLDTVVADRDAARAACRLALNAFERGDCIDWAVVEKNASSHKVSAAPCTDLTAGHMMTGNLRVGSPEQVAGVAPEHVDLPAVIVPNGIRYFSYIKGDAESERRARAALEAAQEEKP